MRNKKFIIHNHTEHYKDYEVFDFITYCLKKGLLSNNKTEYCYCIVRQYAKEYRKREPIKSKARKDRKAMHR